jgi:hypothetical protein
MTIRWYSLDTDLNTVDHEVVDLKEANAIIDRYLQAVRPHYETGEEALAATMFGFIRPDDSYMQISVHSLTAFDVEYDFSLIKNPLLRLLGARRQRGERLISGDQLRARAEQFFTHSREAFQTVLRNAHTKRPGTKLAL